MKIWKKLQSPFERYSVSNIGEVRNDRTGYIFRKNSNLSCGYSRVRLIDSSGKDKYVVVHKLVAETFIPNLENKKEINHINRIRDDNRVENLEWSTRKENCNKKSQSCNKSRAVLQFTLDGVFVKKWDRICDTPYGRSNVSSACSGRLPHAYGSIWKYYEEKIENEIWKELIVGNRKIEISNKGRVRLVSGKITYGFLDENGYKNITIGKLSKRVHRLVVESFLGKIEDKLVDHIDGNKNNNNIGNLRLVDSSENRINSKKVYRNIRKTKVCQIFQNGSKKIFESMAQASEETKNSRGNRKTTCKNDNENRNNEKIMRQTY
jgi:hypothetical protein